MENKIYISNLFDLYEGLLTDKQKEYFKAYYFDDLSLSELSENYDISRNAVHKQIKEAIYKLQFYEEKLMLYQKKKRIYDIMNQIEDHHIKEQLKELL